MKYLYLFFVAIRRFWQEISSERKVQIGVVAFVFTGWVWEEVLFLVLGYGGVFRFVMLSALLWLFLYLFWEDIPDVFLPNRSYKVRVLAILQIIILPFILSSFTHIIGVIGHDLTRTIQAVNEKPSEVALEVRFWSALIIPTLTLPLLTIMNLRRFRPMRSIISIFILLFYIIFLFAYQYSYLYAVDPNAFKFNSFQGDPTYFDFIYFSFVTFMTVGFGDITPASQLAKRWVTMELVFNIFILAFLLGVGVSNWRSHRKNNA